VRLEEQLADLRGCFWGDIGGGSFHRLQSFLRVESSAQIGVSILDVNLLYHSLLGTASCRRVQGHLSEMATIRPCGSFSVVGECFGEWVLKKSLSEKTAADLGIENVHPSRGSRL
jgi:hypothetical protein